jgi:hypothetical protein
MDGGTYLEEYLMSLETLPNDVRRDFELMKDLDRDSIELTKDLKLMEQTYILNLAKSKGVEDTVQLDIIEQLRGKIKQRLSEKTAIGKNVLHELDRFTRKLDTDLAFFETELKTFGDFEQAKKSIEAGSDVAIRPSLTSDEIILGRVTVYHVGVGAYDVADVDDSKRYHLPESQVAPLDMLNSHRRLTKGEEVLAIYPETTSFYPAYIVQAPRRTALGVEPTVIVQFKGDQDETGIIPHRTIALHYVIRPTGDLQIISA